jgi:hypothetical protein
MRIPDEAVINLINEAKATEFDLSPSAIAGLSDRGVSLAVIAVMRQPLAKGSSSPRVSTRGQPSQTPGLKETLELAPSGMQPLTAESLRSALIEGEKNGARMNDSMGALMEKMAARGDVTSADDLPRAASLMTSPPQYSFVLWSPYSAATLLSAEAKRRFEPRQTPSFDDLNRQQIVVAVVPSSNFLKAGSIENVVIKRGSTVLRPIKSEVVPVEIRNGLGARRTVSKGDFTFPFSAFDPSASTTVVLIGDAGNFEWTITREELARMK